MRSGGGVLTAHTARQGTEKQNNTQPAQHIRLTLDASTPNPTQGGQPQAGQPAQTKARPRPVHAKITVQGTNGAWRVMTSSTATAEPTQGSPWIATSLDVDLVPSSTAEGKISRADLELPGFTSVRTIRLDSVSYADGTTWTPVSGHACRVTPDPLMLISSR
jgi:hypothetical protein